MRGRRLQAVLVAGVLAVTGLIATSGGAAGAPPMLSRLTVIRAAHHPGHDRVVFEFKGKVPPVQLRYVKTLIADGSGLPVPVPGRAILAVTMRDTNAHDEQGSAAPAARRNTFALPNVTTVLQSGDFEGVVTYGIGLEARQPFRYSTLTHPSRLVVDINTNFPRTAKRVYFIDVRRFAANRMPFERPVPRLVPAMSPAAGVLDRLFAGPTRAEAASGLQLPTAPSLTARSGATGYSNLSIRNGIARVRLTGGCSSGGSTITVASEIIPTLKQFPSVRYVKIYDPQGRTARPNGPGDSVPDCLQP